MASLGFIPHSRRKYAYPLMAAAVVVLFVAVYAALSNMAESREQKLEDLAARYDKVVPLVAELRALQAQGGGSLRPMEPLAAVQEVSRELKIERNLASVRPMNLVGEKEAVQVFFESINLDQLVGLLEALESMAGLQVFSFNLSRRMDDPDLANLQMVLTR